MYKMNYLTIKKWVFEKILRREWYLLKGKWKMRNGEIATITHYAYKDMLSNFPIQGTIIGDECCQEDGMYYNHKKSPYDLIKRVGK